jgi:nicotinamidase-related amidase
MAETGLIHGALEDGTRHICVDMQRIFAEPTDWHTPWASRVLPVIERLAAARAERTIFTRFIPPRRPEDATGTWRRYYERWATMTRERLHQDLTELVPELQRFVPPARTLDKPVYSPWLGSSLDADLRRAGINTVVISGAETEVCVLAAVVGAIDLGYRVVIATDALCSSADPTHDAMLTIYHSRYGMQVETVEVAELVAARIGELT